MLKLWHIAREGDAYGGARNSNKILLALDEIGEQRELHLTSRDALRAGQGGVGKLNPNRVVPIIDDQGLVLWESGAILRYLADTRLDSPLSIKSPQDAALVQQWLAWEASTYAPALHAFFFALMSEPRSDSAVDAAREAYLNKIQILDGQLAGRDYVAGTFSIADIALGAMVPLSFGVGLDLRPYKNLLGWLRRLVKRQAWRENEIFKADMDAGAAQLG